MGNSSRIVLHLQPLQSRPLAFHPLRIIALATMNSALLAEFVSKTICLDNVAAGLCAPLGVIWPSFPPITSMPDIKFD